MKATHVYEGRLSKVPLTNEALENSCSREKTRECKSGSARIDPFYSMGKQNLALLTI